jgi:glutamine cyclotransferase
MKKLFSIIITILVATNACAKNSVDKDINTLPFNVVQSVPKSRCFTQGLEVDSNILLESCGLYGESEVRAVDIASKSVLYRTPLPENIFTEGLTVFRGAVFMLSWKNEKLYIYNKHDLSVNSVVDFPGEWWGLTSDKSYLIASNGTNKIYYFNPTTFSLVKTVTVTHLKSAAQINELEFIDGFIYANLFNEDKIIKIHPEGDVIGYIDLSKLVLLNKETKHMVLNGIAAHSNKNSLIVTGKLWSNYYVIKLIESNVH